MTLASITGFYQSENGTCDQCGRKAKQAVSVTLPSMAYEYVCPRCLVVLVKAVSQAQATRQQPAPVAGKRTVDNPE